MNKKKLLSNIENVEQLNKLLEDILKLMKLNKVNRHKTNLITAVEEGVMEKKSIIFLTTLSELNGKLDLIKSQIEKIGNSYDIICLISTQKISNYFQSWINKIFPDQTFKFWSNDDLIGKIDHLYPDFWDHNDAFIKPYEEFFLANCKDDSDLRSLLKLDNKYDDLLDIFIEPTLNSYIEDKETKKLTQKKITRDSITNNGNFVISGDAGTGKTTLLKEIGKDLIVLNHSRKKKKITSSYQSKRFCN